MEEQEWSREQKLQAVCELLREQVDHYDWVGFYVTRPGTRELELGPFSGDPTEHVLIPFGRGICGQAAERESTVVVQDVGAESNYLSCSVNVRSEIVVPVIVDGKVQGEMDIDSHALSPFTGEDEKLLQAVCELVAPLL